VQCSSSFCILIISERFRQYGGHVVYVGISGLGPGSS